MHCQLWNALQAHDTCRMLTALKQCRQATVDMVYGHSVEHNRECNACCRPYCG